MKKVIFILSLLVVALCAQAETIENQITRANELYANGSYDEAADIYAALLEKNESADLYYNYATTCYKQGNLALAVLNFERALRLNPQHADAKANLEFVNQQITDKIEPLNVFFITAFFRGLGRSLSSNTWAKMSVVLFVLALVSLLLLIFGKRMVLRKVSFGVMLFCCVFALVSCIYAFSQKRYIEQRVEAIVMDGSVTVKSSPDTSGTEIFVLHEGTKVERQDVLGGWTKIRIADGQVGWLLTTTIQPI